MSFSILFNVIQCILYSSIEFANLEKISFLCNINDRDL